MFPALRNNLKRL